MTILAHTALIAWLVLGVVLFRRYPGPRVVAALYVFGVLFLPELRTAAFVPGVPEPLALPGFKLTKVNAIACGLLVGSLLFDRGRWLTVRPRWFDLPIVVWCLSPLVTSLSNALLFHDPVSRYDPDFLPADAGPVGRLVWGLESAGLYDGLAQVLDTALTWAVPYWLGRLYLADRAGMREAIVWVVLGGLVYVPLCLFETRFSPQLHRWVYGFHQHEFGQSLRLGGYRPMVFMEHGLALGFWMVAAALAGLWLWWTGPLRTVPAFGTRLTGLVVAAPVAATAVLCKSTGALVLGALGLTVLVLCRLTRWPVVVAVLVCAAPLYVVARTGGQWDGRDLVAATEQYLDEDRAASLEYRLRNEEVLVEKAMRRPVVGWGGWGRARVYDADGRDISVTDGLWVITFGERGFLGLTALGLVVLLPVARAVTRLGARPWTEAAASPAAAAALVLVLYSIDSLMNAMVNPVFLLLAGGLTALSLDDPDTPVAPPPPLRPWRVRKPATPKRVQRGARFQLASEPGQPDGKLETRPTGTPEPVGQPASCL